LRVAGTLVAQGTDLPKLVPCAAATCTCTAGAKQHRLVRELVTQLVSTSSNAGHAQQEQSDIRQLVRELISTARATATAIKCGRWTGHHLHTALTHIVPTVHLHLALPLCPTCMT
jgi:hypothetical protein